MTLTDTPAPEANTTEEAAPAAATVTTTTFAEVPLNVIVSSLTNPRKNFDQDKLRELADSIRASGVHQPILLRPLPGSRVQDTFFEVGSLKQRTGPKPTHEIVSGERRYRASQLAGQNTIPAMIRHLTDDQVLEIQMVENLQRDDLSPLEEADGYTHLMQHTGLTAEQVGAKIGKSRSYVYNRLKLLDLGQDGRKAVLEGLIDATVAMLIARIPDGKLQAEALDDVEGMSYREASHYLQARYMLRLDTAKFPITDATLLAGASDCKSCSKRTGANPDLFADVQSKDTCTDPKCFHAKDEAHTQRQLAQAEERGQTIITGKEAKAILPSMYNSKPEGGYLRLDDKHDSPTGKPLRDVLAKEIAAGTLKPTLVVSPHTKDLVAVVPQETVTALLRNKGAQAAAEKLEKEARREAEYEQERQRQDRENALEVEWRWAVLEATWAKAKEHTAGLSSGELLDKVTRHIATKAANRLNADEAKKLCKLLDLGKVAPKEGLLHWVAHHETNPGAALLLLTMFAECGYHRHMMEYSGQDGNDGLWLVAEAFGIDKAVIESQTRANTRAAQASAPTKPEAAQASPPLQPAAQARATRGAKPKAGSGRTPAARGTKPAAGEQPKLSAAFALSGIAAAMQKDESAASTAEADVAGHGAADVHAPTDLSGAADASQSDEAAASTAEADGVGGGAAWPWPGERA